MFRFGILIAGLSLALNGCSSIGLGSAPHPVSTKPPLSAIVLSAAATVNSENATVTFPAGEYRPESEDKGGYYFRAPSKVLVDEIAVYGHDGGLYVARGSTEPRRWYVVGRGDKLTTGRFKVLPRYKVLP